MDVFPVDWLARDVDNKYVITMFGKTPAGCSVAAHITFYPYFYVQVPPTHGTGQVAFFIAQACTQVNAVKRYCRAVERMSMWGFTNNTKHRFVQLAFPSLVAMKAAARKYRDDKMTTYESGMDPLLRFFHIRDIGPSQWVRINSFSRLEDSARLTTTQMEIATEFTAVTASPLTTQPPLILGSWDIEAYSKSRRFPQAENEDDAIIQIATTFQKYGDPKPYRTSVMALKHTADVDGVDVAWFDDEADLINAWCDELARESVDVLVSYNGDQFDWKYVHGRSMVCVDDSTGETHVHLSKLGRLVTGGGVPRETSLVSGAYGDNRFFTLTTPGVLQIDLLQDLRRSHKLDSYSLNNVSKTFLGDAKVDLPAWEIFAKFEGDAADRALIAQYAAKDTVLPLRLLSKLCIFENLAEMSNATFCPAEYVLKRGQQIKVYSVLMKKARAMGYVCPDGVGIGVVGKFVGATVLNAERGAYFDVVSGLDFASLYPSIIRGWSLCFSTIVLDPKYDNLSGIEYYQVCTDQGTFRFAQGFKGVLPSLLEDLATFRKSAKKKMAEAKASGDEFAAAIHNGAQLAFKVTMNSAYGFCGANKGFLSCVPIAASVTATGRTMIAKTKGLVEELVPGSRVVYGDSVAGYTPCIVRDQQGIGFTTFENLASMYGGNAWHATSDGGGKESCELTGVDVWSEAGWTTMHRVIRHKVTKPMVRVVTYTGVLDVTRDHSLLRNDGTPVSPSEVAIGETLMHTPLPRRALSEDMSHLPPVVHTKSQLEAARVFWLAECLGNRPSVETDAQSTYRVSIMSEPANATSVRALVPLPPSPNQYVYDVTTDNHHFHAGIGRLVAHNTDSVMCILNVGSDKRHDLAAHFDVASRLATDISKTFPPPVELEFEKCYYPYLLFSKKRYAGLMFTNPAKHDYVDVKGLQLVRRDNCPLVKDVSSAILDRIMFDRSAPAAVEEARKCILRVLQNHEPLDKFIVSKALRSDYKNEAQPHVYVARKIFRRTGSSIPSGARVPFVFVEDADNPQGLLAERAEDPDHVRTHGLSLDVLHYIEHQLESPIVSLLELLVDDPHKAVFEHESVAPLMHTLIERRTDAIRTAKRIKKNKLNNQAEITAFFKPK